ncbi:hypothetical protein BDQ17DRAFT_1436380 [Cyathus striatus]|nr:hypothetical protein BDQ17DRAFT_1436380 [Cyathus striatus]
MFMVFIFILHPTIPITAAVLNRILSCIVKPHTSSIFQQVARLSPYLVRCLHYTLSPDEQRRLVERGPDRRKQSGPEVAGWHNIRGGVTHNTIAGLSYIESENFKLGLNWAGERRPESRDNIDVRPPPNSHHHLLSSFPPKAPILFLYGSSSSSSSTTLFLWNSDDTNLVPAQSQLLFALFALFALAQGDTLHFLQPPPTNTGTNKLSSPTSSASGA